MVRGFDPKQQAELSQPDTSLLNHFAHLEDPRVERTKAHLLLDIVAIAIFAVISGA